MCITGGGNHERARARNHPSAWKQPIKIRSIAGFNVILSNIQSIQQLYFRARKVNRKGFLARK